MPQGIHALLNQCPKLTHLSLTGVQAFYLREDLITFCREAPPGKDPILLKNPFFLAYLSISLNWH